MADYVWDEDAARKRLGEISKSSGASVEEDDIRTLAGKNPEDVEGHWAKLEEQYKLRGAPTSDRQYDSQDSRAYPQSPSSGTSQYSGGDNANLSALLSMLGSNYQQQQQERSDLRGILMGQLGSLNQPISPDSSGIREILTAGRLSSQRNAERQQSAAAEQLGARGLSDSGAMDTMRLGIEERRAETDQAREADVLYRELTQRRDALNQLLMQALALGDSASARNIQAQLQAIQMQLQQGNFQDDLAFRYTNLNANQNLQALMALMGAF